MGHGQSQQVEEGLGRFQWVLGVPTDFFRPWRVSAGIGKSLHVSVALQWVSAGLGGFQ